jgi:hypothetical protein
MARKRWTWDRLVNVAGGIASLIALGGAAVLTAVTGALATAARLSRFLPQPWFTLAAIGVFLLFLALLLAIAHRFQWARERKAAHPTPAFVGGDTATKTLTGPQQLRRDLAENPEAVRAFRGEYEKIVGLQSGASRAQGVSTLNWEDLDKERIRHYTHNGGVFLIHTSQLSSKPGQQAEVTARLIQHGVGPLSKGQIKSEPPRVS